MASRLAAQEQSSFKGKYDWDQWTDGDIWLIERGVDYTCSDKSFQVIAHNYGRRHGFKVRTGKHPRGMQVQFMRRACLPGKNRKLRRKP